ILVLIIALGATVALAQEPDGADPDSGTEEVPSLPFPGKFGRGGFPGLPEDLTPKGELLANALGITVDDLAEAQEEARIAAIEQAVDAGLLTREQADQILEGNFGFRGFGMFGHHGFGHHGFGPLGGDGIDFDALLADALDISVEDLQAARDEAHAAAIAELVDGGYLTQEQADLMVARQALREYIDGDALMAEALGISPADLQAAREEGTSLSDNVLTQEQADQILSSGGIGGRGFSGPGGFGRHGGPGGFGGNGGFRGFGPLGGGTAPAGMNI
ncbi:MAG: hypothetical protein AMJ56_12515, partial [Anaerolineae bacterium SG8_19]